MFYIGIWSQLEGYGFFHGTQSIFLLDQETDNKTNFLIASVFVLRILPQAENGVIKEKKKKRKCRYVDEGFGSLDELFALFFWDTFVFEWEIIL